MFKTKHAAQLRARKLFKLFPKNSGWFIEVYPHLGVGWNIRFRTHWTKMVTVYMTEDMRFFALVGHDGAGEHHWHQAERASAFVRPMDAVKYAIKCAHKQVCKDAARLWCCSKCLNLRNDEHWNHMEQLKMVSRQTGTDFIEQYMKEDGY